jgi:hypothetical protein
MNRQGEPGAGSGHGGDGAPVRLRDAAATEQPAGLAGALASARLAHQPTAAELDDLRRSLAATLATPAGGAPASGAAAGVRIAVRGAIAAALLTVGAGALWYGVAAPTVSPPTESGTAVAPAAVTPAPVAPAETIAVPQAVEMAPPRAQSAAARPPLELARRRAASGRAARGDDELRLLSRAQQALGSEPALAFSLAERHRRLFPGGALAQEREVIAIEALRGLQKTNAANARAQQFRARYPHSAYLPRVQGQPL